MYSLHSCAQLSLSERGPTKERANLRQGPADAPRDETYSVVGVKIMVFFDVVADEAWLAIGRLRCRNEAKAWIARLTPL